MSATRAEVDSALVALGELAGGSSVARSHLATLKLAAYKGTEDTANSSSSPTNLWEKTPSASATFGNNIVSETDDVGGRGGGGGGSGGGGDTEAERRAAENVNDFRSFPPLSSTASRKPFVNTCVHVGVR